MTSKNNELIKKLSFELMDFTQLFILKNMDEEEDSSDLINLILSSHVSAIITLMRHVSSPYPEMAKQVDEFVMKLISAISNISPITSINVIKGGRPHDRVN